MMAARASKRSCWPEKARLNDWKHERERDITHTSYLLPVSTRTAHTTFGIWLHAFCLSVLTFSCNGVCVRVCATKRLTCVVHSDLLPAHTFFFFHFDLHTSFWCSLCLLCSCIPCTLHPLSFLSRNPFSARRRRLSPPFLISLSPAATLFTSHQFPADRLFLVFVLFILHSSSPLYAH